jgi:hypothetical protein
MAHAPRETLKQAALIAFVTLSVILAERRCDADPDYSHTWPVTYSVSDD